jgi:dihydrofolate reductase
VGRLIVSQFVTVDGVMEDPGGAEDLERGGWAFRFDRGAEGDTFKLDEVMSADALLLGRVTYEGFAAAWPSRKDAAGFADKFNSMPKFVVSSTLARAEWNNSKIIRGELAQEVGELKRRFASGILVNGSATLVDDLAEQDLVDEYRLMVFPVLLGAGKRLFSGVRREHPLRLTDSKPAGACTIHVYEPAR